MYVTDLYVALVVGVTFSLIVNETTGIVPGGMIAPAYLALVLDTPQSVVLIMLISFVCFSLTQFVLPKFIVLYGRRRFVALIIIAIVIKLLCELLFPITPFASFEFRGVGVIVPALIANSFHKQGIHLTLVALIPATIATFAILSIFYYI